MARLTPREEEIVAAVLRGATNREIAAQIGIQTQSVKNALSRIYRKCGARSRLELVLIQVRRGKAPIR